MARLWLKWKGCACQVEMSASTTKGAFSTVITSVNAQYAAGAFACRVGAVTVRYVQRLRADGYIVHAPRRHVRPLP